MGGSIVQDAHQLIDLATGMAASATPGKYHSSFDDRVYRLIYSIYVGPNHFDPALARPSTTTTPLPSNIAIGPLANIHAATFSTHLQTQPHVPAEAFQLAPGPNASSSQGPFQSPPSQFTDQMAPRIMVPAANPVVVDNGATLQVPGRTTCRSITAQSYNEESSDEEEEDSDTDDDNEPPPPPKKEASRKRKTTAHANTTDGAPKKKKKTVNTAAAPKGKKATSK
jgi:hypothetical protein